jgi:hypothetical protein
VQGCNLEDPKVQCAVEAWAGEYTLMTRHKIRPDKTEMIKQAAAELSLL